MKRKKYTYIKNKLYLLIQREFYRTDHMVYNMDSSTGSMLTVCLITIEIICTLFLKKYLSLIQVLVKLNVTGYQPLCITECDSVARCWYCC